MINRNDDWAIIEAAYENLQNAHGLPTDRPASLEEYTDADLRDAADETAYQITGAFPELALLAAFARNGYLDNDQIWDAIGDAVARGLEAYAGERRDDYEDSLDEPEEYWS